jgi:hypothetical protein
LGGFTSSEQSDVRAAVDGVVKIGEELQTLKNRLFVRVAEGKDTADVLEEIRNFNARWPEAAVESKELNAYIKTRTTNLRKGETDVQRLVPKKLEGLLPPAQLGQ